MSLRGRALLALALLFPTLAQAFGPLGHEIVAEIAAQRLTPATRTEVERLLGERASPGLREIATWADTVRNTSWSGFTAPLHYVNVTDGCAYRAQTDCRGGRCAIGALERYVGVLGDRARSHAERADALRWVVHLVADLHQPLHVGRRSDRGGNDVQVTIGGRGSNLHQVWDSGLLYQSGRLRGRNWRAVDYATVLGARGTPAGVHAWSAQAPELWARESCTIMRDVYPDGQRIGDDYVRRHLPTLERRLAEAGWRLAAVLEAVLGPNVAR